MSKTYQDTKMAATSNNKQYNNYDILRWMNIYVPLNT